MMSRKTFLAAALVALVAPGPSACEVPGSADIDRLLAHAPGGDPEPMDDFAVAVDHQVDDGEPAQFEPVTPRPTSFEPHDDDDDADPSPYPRLPQDHYID